MSAIKPIQNKLAIDPKHLLAIKICQAIENNKYDFSGIPYFMENVSKSKYNNDANFEYSVNENINSFFRLMDFGIDCLMEVDFNNEELLFNSENIQNE